MLVFVLLWIWQGNLSPNQNYSNVARSFDRWIPSVENVLATSIAEDLVNCFILEEHSSIGNSETHLNQKQWDIAFQWLDLPK